MAEKDNSRLEQAVKNAVTGNGIAGAINRGLGSPIKSLSNSASMTRDALEAEKQPFLRKKEDLLKAFNNSKDPVQRRSYGKAYLIRKHGSDNITDYLNNEVVEDSIVEEGVDDDNPFVAFLDKVGNKFHRDLSKFYVNCIEEDENIIYRGGYNPLYDDSLYFALKNKTKDSDKELLLNTIQALTTGLDRVNKHRDEALSREGADSWISSILSSDISRESLIDALNKIGPNRVSYDKKKQNTSIDTSNLKKEEKDQLIALLKKIKFNPEEHGISFE